MEILRLLFGLLSLGPDVNRKGRRKAQRGDAQGELGCRESHGRFS